MNVTPALFSRPWLSNSTPTEEPFKLLFKPLSKEFASFAASCFIIIIVTSIICNFVLIVTIVSSKKLHSFSHVFIINLAVSDLVTVIGTVPFDVDFMLHGSFGHGKIACGLMHVTFLISLPSSMLNLTLLTLERFISVVLPFRRQLLITKPTVIAAVFGTWTYTLLVAFYPLMRDSNAVHIIDGQCMLAYPFPQYDIFQLVANFLLPIIFIFIMNLSLFYVSTKQAKKIRRTSINIGRLSSYMKGSDLDLDLLKKKTRKRDPYDNKLKAAKRIALLVSVIFFCWLAYIILVATNVSCGACHPRELTWTGNIVNYSSSAINPLLYGMLNVSIRNEVKKKATAILRKYFSYSSELRRPRQHTIVMDL